MNTKNIHLALISFVLPLGLSANVALADNDLLYGDDDFSIVSTGNDYDEARSKSGKTGVDLAALELHESDYDLLYGDDDISIVLTGAR